jgi:SAM-dependent methyltransferase
MWDQRYARDTYAYGTEPNDFLRQAAASLPVGTTLCLGEGEGRNAVYLAALGHQVTAVDASLVGLEKARRLAERKGVEITTIHADLADYDFAAGRWDLIVSIFCHLPPPLRTRVHRQAVKALTPGGAFVLEAYTPDQLHYATGGPPTAEMMMDLASLQQELQGLEIIHGVETLREIHEGEFHQGRGAVVQVIAIRS